MAGLQRSVTSFRRQGSSGLVWDDKLLSGEFNRLREEDNEDNKDQGQQQEHQGQFQEVRHRRSALGSINTTMERSRSNGGGRAFRTGKVSPAIEPSSPRVSACGFCSAFGKKEKTRRRPKLGKRRT